ncbi:MAG: rod shape-determining protein RodA [Flavobacteriales bacterium]|nr:rod shape-determining protein RodA [Flavobacteriales bacterium]
MRTRGELIGSLDRPLLLMYLALIMIGWINIYAANYIPEHPNIFDTSREYGMQFIWICLGMVAGFSLLLFSGEFYRRNAIFIYGGVILLLIAVLLFGREVNGAKSWFGVGGFGIQPSEFSKIGTALVISTYLSDIGQKTPTRTSLLVSFGLIGLPALLILLQPDAGTLLVFSAFLLVLYREGLIGNIIFIGIGLLMVAISTLFLIKTQWEPIAGFVISGEVILTVSFLLIGVLVFFIIKQAVLPRFRKKNIRGLIMILIVSMISVWTISFIYHSDSFLKPHHKTRIDVLFGHKEDPSGAGYNVIQSKTAIGSGGFAGKGFLDGVLTKYKYVPMQSTDFIFCTVGEEWGFLGTTTVIILFMGLLLRIIHLAERQRSAFTRIFAYSVASIIFLHVLINIGMAIGLAPVIGIPLPFFSYGGSSFLNFTAMIFILLRLDSERLEVFR